RWHHRLQSWRTTSRRCSGSPGCARADKQCGPRPDSASDGQWHSTRRRYSQGTCFGCASRTGRTALYVWFGHSRRTRSSRGFTKPHSRPRHHHDAFRPKISACYFPVCVGCLRIWWGRSQRAEHIADAVNWLKPIAITSIGWFLRSYSMPVQARPHANIVGSGPNGLTSAALLAQAGWHVRVYERNAQIGGAAASADVFGDGSIVDLGAAAHPFGVASPIFRHLGLEDYGLKWLH